LGRGSSARVSANFSDRLLRNIAIETRLHETHPCDNSLIE